MTGTIDVSCRNEPAVCRNVEGVIGPDTDQELLVTAHVDSHDVGDGARDNGTGCAIVAEIGRVLQLVADELEYKIRLIIFGGEETGLLGSTQWANTHDLSSVVGQINLDGIGYSRNLGVKGKGLLPHFSSMEATNTGPILTLEQVSPFNDTWPFLTAGVPSVSCRSTTGNEEQVARYGNLEWGHTHADTLDKLDPRDIRDLAILIMQGAYSCATTPREDRVSQDEVTTLAAGDLEEYLKIDNRWPY
jgi:Zn-dependent M28 family amino/carboxypeptidase